MGKKVTFNYDVEFISSNENTLDEDNTSLESDKTSFDSNAKKINRINIERQN